jgi:hypothetical protein
MIEPRMHKHEHRDRYSSFVTVALKILVLLLVLAGAGFAASEPKYFGWISFLLALLMLSRLEMQKSVHERSFYYLEPPTPKMIRIFRQVSLGEVFIKSAIIGSLAMFAVTGRTSDGLHTVVTGFIFCVMLGSAIIYCAKRYRKFDVVRWGFARLSIILGIVFSEIISSVPGISGAVIIKRFLWSPEDVDTLREAVQTFHGVSYKLNNLTDTALSKALGDVLATPVQVVLSTDVTYGFVILPYCLLVIAAADAVDHFIGKDTAARSIEPA